VTFDRLTEDEWHLLIRRSYGVFDMIPDGGISSEFIGRKMLKAAGKGTAGTSPVLVAEMVMREIEPLAAKGTFDAHLLRPEPRRLSTTAAEIARQVHLEPEHLERVLDDLFRRVRKRLERGLREAGVG
jgi:hypothetical protein